MSNIPFSFPPPPPPPPRRPSENDVLPSRGGSGGFGGDRGRGAFRGSRPDRRGRGAGNGFGRGGSGGVAAFPPSFAARGGGENGNHKRDHNTAFHSSNHMRSRPQAAPAVPSFNANISSLVPPKPALPSKVEPATAVRKQNLLGLTPMKVDASDSEDDGDEEDKLAASVDGLQFEYRGKVSNLQSAAEIAAWIAERRKRYPTQAKIAVAKEEAEERRQKWEEEKKARLEASRQARDKRDQERKEQREARMTDNASRSQALKTRSHHEAVTDPASRAKLRAEKLRRKALKAQKDLEDAERALQLEESASAQDGIAGPKREGMGDVPEERSTNGTEYMALVESAAIDRGHGGLALFDSDAGSPETSSDSLELEETSSSGSDSELDSAPEEITSKLEVPPPVQMKQGRPTMKPCQHFMKTGRCKYGDDCKYSHTRPTSSKAASQPSNVSINNRRKGLWQVLVEKEREEEQKQMLRAIIMLGEKGMLQEPPAT